MKLIKPGANPWYEVKIAEGRQNQIRIMFKHFGRLVEKLRRVKIGFLELDVAPGSYRPLTPKEVERFRKMLKLDAEHSMANIPEILKISRTIAVVGLSSNPMRASNGVSAYMQRAGYRIIPVNPKETEVLGEKSYARLEDVPEKIDIVNVFRRPEFVPEIVESAIKVGAKTVWMQEGVVNEAAAERARAAGLKW